MLTQKIISYGVTLLASAGLCLAVSTSGFAAQKTPSQKSASHKAQAKKTQLAASQNNKKQASRKKTYYAKAPPRPSNGQLAGLNKTHDPLDLKSNAALVLDSDTQEVLFSKNDSAVLPIASITKLMTGLIVSEAKLPLDEIITITSQDVVGERGVRSRLKVGTSLTRGELLHLALMSSENRAAHALGRTYPGGMAEFVKLMNNKANELGMSHTRYVEPTGLSSENQSSAQDLARLVAIASSNEQVSQLSTSHGYQLAVGNKTLQYVNTNRLTSNPSWDIAIQKTGYIAAAGRCLVMQTTVAGRKLVMVFLDSVGKYSRLGDAERVRTWLESRPAGAPHAALTFPSTTAVLNPAFTPVLTPVSLQLPNPV